MCGQFLAWRARLRFLGVPVGQGGGVVKFLLHARLRFLGALLVTACRSESPIFESTTYSYHGTPLGSELSHAAKVL